MSYKFSLPEEWTLEDLDQNHILVRSPAPDHLMATLDLKDRGIRSGLCRSGRFIDEEPFGMSRSKQKRKAYAGRGWQQKMMDDAVKFLKAIK